MTATGPHAPILVVDTATRRAVIALGTPSGTVIAERSWVAGYRHGEELLAQVEGLLAAQRTAAASLGGLVVGTGPGAFTGLRVGIATVKGLGYALGIPVAGVATAEALLAASADVSGMTVGGLVLLQPAGPSDLVLTRPGERPRIVPGGEDPGLRPGERVVAIDLDGRIDAASVARGDTALGGLGAALLELGAARLANGAPDELATLVPEYVTMPRGVRTAVPDAAVEVTSGVTVPGSADRPSRDALPGDVR